MIVACVRVGDRYPFEYVERLFNMVRRNMPPIAFSFCCITDQPERAPGINFIELDEPSLPGWWAKMMLFQKPWRAGHSVIYFDLDTIICNDLAPLVAIKDQFAICANFTRAAGNKSWPCRYGSCVMTMHHSLNEDIWRRFAASSHRIMQRHNLTGDQAAIEELYPDARLLQEVTPSKFLISYRDIGPVRDERVSVINFGGKHKPHNCSTPWVRSQWH